jgi:hypothetical protein
METTYKIVRMFFDPDRPMRTIKRGLTLEQAQAHCHRPETRGNDRNGLPWFDGYDEEKQKNKAGS